MESEKKQNKKSKGSSRIVIAVILFTISAVSLGYGLYNLNIYRSADSHNYQVSQNITVAPVPDEVVEEEEPEEETTEIEEEETPLAVEEKAEAGFPWYIILIIVAICAVAGITVYTKKRAK